MNTKNFVSIIIPCRNEERYIEDCLSSVMAFDFDHAQMEVLVVDGMSDDATKQIVLEFAKRYPIVKILDNIERTTPFGMNIGIRHARGDIIVRLDAHSAFPEDYITKLLYWSDKLDADNVGGVVETLPANSSLKAEAISIAMSSSFGVGNSYFRVGADVPMKVDTVPFGCYKKDVFEKIGLYDEELTRNQDDELNARLIEKGGNIWLIPEIKIQYHARPTFRDIYHMFYQYGYFKPLVNLKLEHPATMRQFVPLLFVLFLIVGGMASLFSETITFIYFAIIALYVSINLIVSASIALKKEKVRLIPYLCISFLTIHVRYGYGYLKGIVDFIVLKKRKSNVALTR